MTYHNKKCRHCGSKATIMLASIDKVLCNDCKQYTDRPLKPEQESVLIHNKIGTKNG